MSAYSLHVLKWKDCTRCELSECRKNVVLYRGSIPCDVLILGEAPGDSEDVLGKPFKGPAGHLLDDWLTRSGLLDSRHRIGYTNLVACIPKMDGKKSEPSHDQILACQPRLEEVYKLARPKAVVAVGKLSEEYTEIGMKYSLKIGREVRRVKITHPAAALRANEVQQGHISQQSIVRLRDVLAYLEGV